jgi:hypothetical protein
MVFVWQDPQRHVPAQPRVAGAVDLTHADCAERVDNFVGADATAGGETIHRMDSAASYAGGS